MADESRAGLQDRSRAPHPCPHKTSDSVAALIVAARRAHPAWGPQLLLDWLRPRHPRMHDWPATSTAGALLKREGLVESRRRRRHSTHPSVVDPVTADPNDLWTADFTGQFLTQDRVYCFPFTLADLHCRYFLECHGLPSVHGAHERLHRTVKREAISPPRANARARQRAFDAFRREYNEERPHSHHGGTPPGAHYTPSPRPYGATPPPLDYPGTSSSNASPQPGRFAFNPGCCTSPTHSTITMSASKKPTMGSGRFTSAPCCFARRPSFMARLPISCSRTP